MVAGLCRRTERACAEDGHWEARGATDAVLESSGGAVDLRGAPRVARGEPTGRSRGPAELDSPRLSGSPAGPARPSTAPKRANEPINFVAGLTLLWTLIVLNLYLSTI